jgi:hypothetical protein
VHETRDGSVSFLTGGVRSQRFEPVSRRIVPKSVPNSGDQRAAQGSPTAGGLVRDRLLSWVAPSGPRSVFQLAKYALFQRMSFVVHSRISGIARDWPSGSSTLSTYSWHDARHSDAAARSPSSGSRSIARAIAAMYSRSCDPSRHRACWSRRTSARTFWACRTSARRSASACSRSRSIAASLPSALEAGMRGGAMAVKARHAVDRVEAWP